MSSRTYLNRIFAGFCALVFSSVVGSTLASHDVAHAAPKVDVVVVVDNSVSMKDPGMDPDRSSLLVSKLLADLVPGHLAVVRLLDVSRDEKWLPREETDERVPCHDDPRQTCTRVIQKGDWEELVRENRHGAKERPSRGDPAFKNELDDHLQQEIANSAFTLAFRAAQGIFDKHQEGTAGGSDIPRTVVWLSDGKPEQPENCRRALDDLKRDGVVVETILFGEGDDTFARSAGLEPRRVTNAREMMKAFAGLFRRMVGAPFQLDGEIAQQNTFEMKSHVDEAWVVIYGDKTLGNVELVSPGGGLESASYASDVLDTAGAYKVAHFVDPAAGTWAIQVQKGGPRVAFAVVQLLDVSPYLITPGQALLGAEVTLLAGVRAGETGQKVTHPDLLSALTMTAEVDGRTVTLRDDGQGGDETAGDGQFSGKVTFSTIGEVPVRLSARSELVDREAVETVEIAGSFEYTGGPVAVDLGRLTEDASSCKSLTFDARQQGAVAFQLELLGSLPGSHALELRSAQGKLVPGGDPVALPPGEPLTVCLITGPRAGSSTATSEPWLEFRVAGTTDARHAITIQLSWQVDGLSWLERWLWLILLLLGLLSVLFLVMGYVLPDRFPRSLAVGMAESPEDLADLPPTPIKQWKGAGIGFYRDARAYLLSSFRITGKPRGAVVKLHMKKRGLWVEAARGSSLFHETPDDQWEEVRRGGQRARGGDRYRVGEGGFYFSISLSRRRR